MQANGLGEFSVRDERCVAPHVHVRRFLDADRTPWLIAALFILLHVLLALWIDASDPNVFVRADRAAARLKIVLGLLASDSTEQAMQYLASQGIVGDYGAHALLYLLGGRFAVVSVQVVLAVVSGVCIYRLGTLLGLSRRVSALAMTVYLFMPHVLVFPHQLATEALHAPLFVICNWLLAKGCVERKLSWLIGSAVCLGLATLIRPITLLWPFVAALAILICYRPRQAAIYAAVAYLPVLLWMGFIGLQTGEFGLGRSDHSLERNLYGRVMRITDTLPPAERDAARAAYLPLAQRGEDRELGQLAYLRFSLAYPAASVMHLLHDATVFFFKSGVERLTIDYLALTSNPRALQDPDHGWRQQLEIHGWPYTLRYMWRALGPPLAVSLLGAAGMLALFLFALVGALHFLRRLREIRTPRVALGTLLVAVVAYIFLFSQVLNAMQSRQRAPAEFAIVLLAAVGFTTLRSRYKGRGAVARSFAAT